MTVETKPVLIFFHSSRSGPSRRAEAFLANALNNRRNRAAFRLVRVEADERPDLCGRFGIEQPPALVVVEDRRVRARLLNPGNSREIRRTLAPWMV